MNIIIILLVLSVILKTVGGALSSKLYFTSKWYARVYHIETYTTISTCICFCIFALSFLK